MGERKVLNKYFPPDFDPAKLPRGKRPEHNVMKVRMMLPMSIRCGTCGTYMYKGTKFNSRKEDVENENYLGIQVFRFYFRCSACAAEITMKTDPQNADYAMELGATRNFEPWREKDKAVAEAKAEREDEEKGNAMKALENRTLDSKREMDIMNALDEMQSLNARHERVDTAAALAALKRSAQTDELDLDEQDEMAVRMMFSQRAQVVRRLPAQPADANGTQRSQTHQDAGPAAPGGAAVADLASTGARAQDDDRLQPGQAAHAGPPTKPRLPQVVIKAKRKADDVDSAAAKVVDQQLPKKQDTGTSANGSHKEPDLPGLGGGLVDYGSSGSSQ